jgi:hypothetical protein
MVYETGLIQLTANPMFILEIKFHTCSEGAASIPASEIGDAGSFREH